MAVVLNDLVVSRICSFLPVSDLKNVRLLNSTWKRGAASSFRQKSRIQLDVSADTDGVAKLEKCLSEMAHFGNCLHLGIDIQITLKPDLASFIPLCRQFATDLIRPGIISLVLRTNVWDKESLMSQLVEDILHHFSPNLEHLELRHYFGSSDPALELRPGDNLTFPKLKTLKDCSTPFVVTGLKPFYSKLLCPDAMPSLEIVELDEPYHFFRQVEQENNLFEKLSALDIGQFVTDEELELIAKTNWKLVSLSLAIENNCEEDCLSPLTRIIGKMSSSLEHLDLSNIPGIIVIPSCPKLKTLSTSFCLCENEPLPNELLGLQFEGVEEETGYFPALEELTVEIYNGHSRLMELEYNEFYRNYIRGMFPEESVYVFRDLRILKVPREWEVVEQDIRTRFPPQLQINYIDNYWWM